MIERPRASSHIDTVRQLERVHVAPHDPASPTRVPVTAMAARRRLSAEDDDKDRLHHQQALSGWLDCLTIEVQHRDSQSFYRARSSQRFFFVLRSECSEPLLRSFADDSLATEHGSIRITTDSSAFVTTLAEHSFQVVTPFVVIHMRAADDTERSAWLDALHAAIQCTSVPPVLPQRVLHDARHDVPELYEVLYATRKPLGMGLSQQPNGQWAEVSRADATAGMFVGSFLNAINSQPVLLLPFEEVLQRLQNWTPPMLLEFRSAPYMAGQLLKRHRGAGRRTSAGRIGAGAGGMLRAAADPTEWVEASYSLDSSRVLRYRLSPSPQDAKKRMSRFEAMTAAASGGLSRMREAVKQQLSGRGATLQQAANSGAGRGSMNVDSGSVGGTFLMRGGCVRTVTPEEAGIQHAFLLLNGTERLVLAAPDEATRDCWCAHLHYAFAIANGGGFIRRDAEEALASVSPSPMSSAVSSSGGTHEAAGASASEGGGGGGSGSGSGSGTVERGTTLHDMMNRT